MSNEKRNMHSGLIPSSREDVTETKADEIKKALPGPISALLANEWKARESGVYFNTHEVVPPASTALETVLRPEFWANVSQKMRKGDTIITLPRDGSWYAELVVFEAGQNWAVVALKCHIEPPQVGRLADPTSDFEVFQDPLEGMIVRMKSSKQKVAGPLPNRADADRWIADHHRALRR